MKEKRIATPSCEMVRNDREEEEQEAVYDEDKEYSGLLTDDDEG